MPPGSCAPSWPSAASCASFPACASNGTRPPNLPSVSKASSPHYTKLTLKERNVDKELLKQARLRLDGAQRILVSSHVRPDGDAVCSVLALGLGPQDKGKHRAKVLGGGGPAGLG